MNEAERQAFKQEVVGVFDRAAPIYDQVGVQRFTYFGNRLIERLAIPPGAKVLDVAAGRGALLFPAAERVGSSGQVIGIDLAPTMVEETAAEISRRGLTQAEIRLADADEIEFNENTFDFIVCGFALHFLRYEQVLPKLYRWLKPQSCFAASIPFVPQGESRTRWQWLFELTRAVFPSDFVPPLAWVAPNLLAKPEVAEATLTNAGFIKVIIEQHEATLYYQDEEDWWAWQWSQGSRFWVEGMSPEGRERFKRESFEHLRQMQEPEGIPVLDGSLFVLGYK